MNMFVSRAVSFDGIQDFNKKAFLPIVHVSFYNFKVVLVEFRDPLFRRGVFRFLKMLPTVLTDLNVALIYFPC